VKVGRTPRAVNAGTAYTWLLATRISTFSTAGSTSAGLKISCDARGRHLDIVDDHDRLGGQRGRNWAIAPVKAHGPSEHFTHARAIKGFPSIFCASIESSKPQAAAWNCAMCST
jgi:hypothetical protein